MCSDTWILFLYVSLLNIYGHWKSLEIFSKENKKLYFSLYILTQCFSLFKGKMYNLGVQSTTLNSLYFYTQITCIYVPLCIPLYIYTYTYIYMEREIGKLKQQYMKV